MGAIYLGINGQLSEEPGIFMFQNALLEVLVDCFNDFPSLGDIGDGLCRDEVFVVVLQSARGGHQMIHIHALNE